MRSQITFMLAIVFAILLGTAMLNLTGCETKPKEEIISPTQPPPAAEESVRWPTISWDSKGGKEWSKFVLTKMVQGMERNYSKAKDADKFCKNFKNLDAAERAHLWTEMIAQITLYESAYKPTAWMTESTMGTDPITGKQVKSEGLMQLSYQDIQWAPYCKFDWSKDKSLGQNDPSKTIFNPITNLSCGMQILEKQILNKGSVTLSSGVYWAVLKINGKYTKIPQITAATNKLSFCK